MRIPKNNADLDENCPITKAIDRGGGQDCNIAGVLRELDRAGFVIVAKADNRANTFADGIEAAAELVRKRLGDLDHYPCDPELGEEVAANILTLTPQAKP